MLFYSQYDGTLNAAYYDSSQNKCIICTDPCKTCRSETECITW